MTERPVCGACNGYGQTRNHASGPYQVCAACAGTGRVAGGGAAAVLADVGPAARPLVVGTLVAETAGAHAGHVAEYDGAVWHCVTCPGRPVVPAPGVGAGPARPGQHAGHTAEYDGTSWRCVTCPDRPPVPAPHGA